MRRCELAGVGRDLLNLDAGTLAIEITQVVVDGEVIESDGKTENAQHVLERDPFTLTALKAHIERLDRERAEFGPDYHDHDALFCRENGKPPHPGYDHASVQAVCEKSVRDPFLWRAAAASVQCRDALADQSSVRSAGVSAPDLGGGGLPEPDRRIPPAGSRLNMG